MEHRTLSDVICDNTYIEKVQQNALQSPHPVTNPVKLCKKSSENRDPSNVPVDSNAVQDNGDKIAVNKLKGHTNHVPRALPKQVRKQHQNNRFPKSLRVTPRHFNNPIDSLQAPAFFDSIFGFQAPVDIRPKVTDVGVSKPVKFLERFDHGDAIWSDP